jgi:deoxyribonuclease V
VGRPSSSSAPGHPTGLAEARALQERLRAQVVERDELGPVARVAGVDAAYTPDGRAHAAVVVLDAETLEVLEVASVCDRVRFPYVSGYLSFRELPALLAAFAKLRLRPDLVIVDGHGRAHPRRFGLACHLGVSIDVPTIGCAKSRLVGVHRPPAVRRGSRTRLRQGSEVIGEVVRTRDGARPVYVSVGHRISLETARRWILRLTPRTRIPEPVRAAHAAVTRLRCQEAHAPVTRPAARRRAPAGSR